MTICSEISRWGTDGLTDVWTPTTLDALGKDEDYLEQVLATSIPLLGIESRRTGVHGPFQVIRQLPLTFVWDLSLCGVKDSVRTFAGVSTAPVASATAEIFPLGVGDQCDEAE